MSNDSEARKYLKVLIFYPVWFCFIAFCFLLGCVIIWYASWDKIYYSELRANENRRAIEHVTALAKQAESGYLETNKLPTLIDLNPNCIGSKICAGATTATINRDGDLLVTYSKPGVPFTPTSKFKVTWNSKTRKTDRELLVSEWSWWLLSVPYILMGIAIILLPFFPIINRKYIEKKHNKKRNEMDGTLVPPIR